MKINPMLPPPAIKLHVQSELTQIKTMTLGLPVEALKLNTTSKMSSRIQPDTGRGMQQDTGRMFGIANRVVNDSTCFVQTQQFPLLQRLLRTQKYDIDAMTLSVNKISSVMQAEESNFRVLLDNSMKQLRISKRIMENKQASGNK
ncbi:Hypothetical_protein [Hexamita inflata]|uniref:Hypothetical_protein n=1 Tax=Hexamita inflata TaxID=28002 RepID=A0AA86PUW4_9EUKA|nr:Hypothetical protein HINF_LOCUS34400 [Hexamita inflata]CAI9971263.1 Hypothetical protein HINF_LOCUS58908 [Hexamita inflata]CAI9976015.1 Hypothetical protein HINF_LOCUS63660 [Hexamita inflata]